MRATHGSFGDLARRDHLFDGPPHWRSMGDHCRGKPFQLASIKAKWRRRLHLKVERVEWSGQPAELASLEDPKSMHAMFLRGCGCGLSSRT